MGRESKPLVVIDNFSGRLEPLREAGQAAQYHADASFYPGLRAPAHLKLDEQRRGLIGEVLSKVFGFTTWQFDQATFALVTTAEQELHPLQRIPHFDKTDGQAIASVHYLLGPESGGTAFYRHRRTGFETVPPIREAEYFAAVDADVREYGEPPARYYHGDSERYEQIAEVEARPDRIVFYRSRQLHSGVIPDGSTHSANPALGRLTITRFFRGA